MVADYGGSSKFNGKINKVGIEVFPEQK